MWPDQWKLNVIAQYRFFSVKHWNTICKLHILKKNLLNYLSALFLVKDRPMVKSETQTNIQIFSLIFVRAIFAYFVCNNFLHFLWIQMSQLYCSTHFVVYFKFFVVHFSGLALYSKVKQWKCSHNICDWIYENRSKSHIGSYDIIDFKDFNTL